jgi:hypothetical protein
MEDLKFQTAGEVMNWSNSNKDCDFQSNRNSGFQMNVNGFRISIQFGPGNYVADGDIRYRTEQDAPMTFKHWGTDTAEVLIWDRNNMPIDWENSDEVVGWVKSDTVGRLIGCLASCPPDFDPTAALNQIIAADQ